MKLSIVTTLYKSEDYIDEFINRTITVAESFSKSFEIIIVNDGSPDSAYEKAINSANADARIKLIDLTRNFGHHPALLTGLSHASGDYVYLIDSDLEESPEWLPEFYEHLKVESADLIIGVQTARKGRLFERLSGKLFYKMLHTVSESRYPPDQTTARLMTRRFLDSLLMFKERETCFASLFELVGFKQTTLPVKKLSTSPTTYTFRRKLALSFTSFSAFSTAPLYMMFYGGIVLAILSLFVATYFTISYFLTSEIPSGWTSLIVSVWFLGGVIIGCLGVIGIYLAMALAEAKQRPRTLIREIYQAGEND